MQWAPSDKLEFFIDGLISKADHGYERNDLNLAIRSTNTNIPVNVELNEDNIVTRATIANPVWLNENRPYHEDIDFSISMAAKADRREVHRRRTINTTTVTGSARPTPPVQLELNLVPSISRPMATA